jgi:23S rRNA-/tRNA-specific pseudouridylate synthase
MIHGVVSRNREATISLVVVNESRQTKLITAVIDTGQTHQNQEHMTCSK